MPLLARWEGCRADFPSGSNSSFLVGCLELLPFGRSELGFASTGSYRAGGGCDCDFPSTRELSV